MIELELTPDIRRWLDTPAAGRDIEKGAELLLRVNRNRIFYNNVLRNPKAYAERLEYQLRKILKQRLVDTTHEQVRGMMAEVDGIAADRGLVTSARSEFQRGKRADHDLLPPEVQKLYVDNADIMRRMREAHTRLRMINSSNSTCPDSDRYPLAKDIIRLDKQYRDNWNLYDHYVRGTALEDTVPAVDARTAAKNASRTLNMLLGKYARQLAESGAYGAEPAAEVKNPLAERIRALYRSIPNPSEKQKEKMTSLGLL